MSEWFGVSTGVQSNHPSTLNSLPNTIVADEAEANVDSYGLEVLFNENFTDWTTMAPSHESAEEILYAAETGNFQNPADFFRDILASRNMTSLDFQNINYSHYPISPPNYPMLISVNICNTLGLLCIFLNCFVVYALLRNRRRVLANVFYVLVLHCAFVDLIRGTCLVAWGMPNLLINQLNTVQDRLLLLKINQFTLIVLRSCNFLTIFNLLVFTTNEFIVIKFPLHYRRYFRRRTVLVILACSWIISVFFGVGSVFSNFFPSAHSVLVLTNGTAYLRGKSYSRGPGLTRREMDGVSINVICMLMIFVLCYLCLIIVLICYGTILRTIRQFHSGDKKGRFNNEESQKFNRSTMHSTHHCSSQKCVEIDRDGRSTVVANGNSNVPESAKSSTVSQPRCNSHRKWRTHLMSRHKYLIVIGSVLFVDILFLFPYSGIQLVAFLQINKLLDLSPKSSLIRYGFQILIGIHSVCQPLCYFRMNEFRRLACCCAQPKISRSKSFSQSKEGLASNDEETNTPLQTNPRQHHYQPKQHKISSGSNTDPINKRLRHHHQHQKEHQSVGPVRRLSRLISQSLLDSETESDCGCTDSAPDLILPAVTVIVPNEQIEDPELPHTPTESELEHILDCGLGSPFLETNWNRVVGASLRFRGNFPDDEQARHKLSTLSDMRSSTCFERESFCLPSDCEDNDDNDHENVSRRSSHRP
ncbi:unnamed protein product [Bursaphelenchus okinawaensis]|uniref:G-protein coupled receptors family 1 profile domain-containing protein n=1 Tax=Bursaphelenchus okinawaensis TaxID=465554 RepID=A0A811LD73_9BILA|nr:unnamed protein product [Bursaphelenchus okinawaensis]CAG9121010.1 unnamed protein product [Bursaphelenchus okinawaensis]